GDLAVQRAPRAFLGPLAHALSPEAPSGLVHGLARSIGAGPRTYEPPEPAPRAAPRAWRTVFRSAARIAGAPSVGEVSPAPPSPAAPDPVPAPEPVPMPIPIPMPPEAVTPEEPVTAGAADPAAEPASV